MKTIKLKAVKEEIVLNGNGIEQPVILKTIDLLRLVINQKVEGGYNISEIKQRCKILGMVDKYKKEFDIPAETLITEISEDYFKKTAVIKLEDEDYKALSEWAKGMKWGVLSNFIIEFVESFN